MKKLALLLVVAAFALTQTAQAALVPNGDFALYNDATGSRSETVTADIWVLSIGPDRPVEGGTVTFEDNSILTVGGIVDIPGWITGPGTSFGSLDDADAYSAGVASDGTTCMNVFGSGWGGIGGLAMTADPLVVPGTTVTISAMFQGNPAPIQFDLLVDGGALVPDAVSIDPGGDDWRELTRTYYLVPAGDVRIVIGVAPGAAGSRLKIDNVSIVPEPATATLAALGLGGLLMRRRRAA